MIFRGLADLTTRIMTAVAPTDAARPRRNALIGDDPCRPAANATQNVARLIVPNKAE